MNKNFGQDSQEKQDKKQKSKPADPVPPFAEWEIAREADEKWSKAALKLHASSWQLRIARHQEIDASIAAKADHEYL